MSPFAALAGTLGAVDLRPGPRQLPLRTSYESIFLGLRRAPSSGDSVIHLRPLHRRRFLHMRSRFCCARYPSSRCFSSRHFLRGRLHRRLSWGDTPYPYPALLRIRPTMLPGPFIMGGNCQLYHLPVFATRILSHLHGGVCHLSPFITICHHHIFNLFSPRHQ